MELELNDENERCCNTEKKNKKNPPATAAAATAAGAFFVCFASHIDGGGNSPTTTASATATAASHLSAPGSHSSAPSLITAALAGSTAAVGGGIAADASSVGTWKLIKGKVSQTIEDIKSSKSSHSTGNQSHSIPSKGGEHEADSDQDSYHHAIDDHLTEAGIGQKQKHHRRHHHHHHQHQREHGQKGHHTNDDSDTDEENEHATHENAGGDSERSRLKRGLANLKSKVKSKHHQHSQSTAGAGGLMAPISTALGSGQVTPTGSTGSLRSLAGGGTAAKDISPSRPSSAGGGGGGGGSAPQPTASTTSSLRSAFMRKRRKPTMEPAAEPSTATTQRSDMPPPAGVTEKAGGGSGRRSKGIIAGRKELPAQEIESGVEMLEDMVPATTTTTSAGGSSGGGAVGEATTTTTLEQQQHEQQQRRQGMGLPLKRIHLDTGDNYDDCDDDMLKDGVDRKYRDARDGGTLMHQDGSFRSDSFRRLLGSRTAELVLCMSQHIPLVTVFALTLVLLLPIPEFIRGVFACLLTIALFEAGWQLVQRLVERFLVEHPPEKTTFRVPDYSKMSICEIPAVEEHKTVKTYAGWLNEATSYDPNNFSIAMTKSVYVKLDGTTMRLSTTTARIPKRIMWNEPPVDKKAIVFTEHRTFNMLGCRIELLPLGLARKRYFNRKYPIQLIIKGQSAGLGSVGGLGFVAASGGVGGGGAYNDAASSAGGSTANTSKRPSTAGSQRHDDGEVAATAAAAAADNADDRSERSFVEVDHEGLDFASTILNADLQTLQDIANPDAEGRDQPSVPCGDEVRLLLFTRGDREKEDWYRRFVAASSGEVYDQNLRLQNVRFVNDMDLQAAATKAAIMLTAEQKANATTAVAATDDLAEEEAHTSKASAAGLTGGGGGAVMHSTPPDPLAEKTTALMAAATIGEGPDDFVEVQAPDVTSPATADRPPSDADASFEGLLMSACAARNPADYIRFMALYQSACNETRIPVHKKTTIQFDGNASNRRSRRRAKRQEDELWKGIDQSLFLGPSGSVVWLNVLLGRVLYSCLNDVLLQSKVQDFLQKKLSSIKLPGFMEDVVITQINLGQTPPLIHRVSRPMLDERGTWLDADITYEGLLQITVTTKLNLLRLRRQGRSNTATAAQPPLTGGSEFGGGGGGAAPSANTSTTGLTPPTASGSSFNLPPINVIADELTLAGVVPAVGSSTQLADDQQLMEALSGSAIFDSDAESSGGSSTEAESPTVANPTEVTNTANEFNVFNTSPGNARRIFKIVDRFAASNFFQYATELSYVQRAMENMSANITLRIDLKGLVGRGIINLPPPPSDRIWLAFRGPPRLWITAKPTVGDKSLDWSIVTNVIESKLCEAVNKYLVFPNMVDIMIPFLGQSTYKE